MPFYIRENGSDCETTFWIKDTSWTTPADKQRTSVFEEAIAFSTIEAAVKAMSHVFNDPRNIKKKHGIDWWFEIQEINQIFSSVGFRE